MAESEKDFGCVHTRLEGKRMRGMLGEATSWHQMGPANLLEGTFINDCRTIPSIH